MDVHTLLQRLFHEYTVRVFDNEAFVFACTCNVEKVSAMLKLLGGEEVAKAVLEQGSIDATAAQNEFAAGYLAVEAAVKAVQKKPAPDIKTLNYYLVDRQNMDDADNQKLLFPVTR